VSVPSPRLPGYRASGATAPYGDLLAAHVGVAMEGYFWRFTLPDGRVLIALCGVNQGPDGSWATLGVATSDGALVLADPDGAVADPAGLGVRVGTSFVATADTLAVELPGASIRVRVARPVPWPRRSTGGSSVFQSVPHLNQYWHPWLLGGYAVGTAVVDGQSWTLDGAQVYAEKNWGREGFPDSWWWGQAHFGATDPAACLAFAGGQVSAGPFRTEVTGLVVRLPDSRVLRLGDPVVSPVTAAVGDTTWQIDGTGRLGRTRGWRVRVLGKAPLGDAHVLPVPLPSERRNTAGAIEHLSATVEVDVEHRGRTVWRGATPYGALEHGGLDRAEAELRRRGAPAGAVGAPPAP
jgi:hypothetical protein